MPNYEQFIVTSACVIQGDKLTCKAKCHIMTSQETCSLKDAVFSSIQPTTDCLYWGQHFGARANTTNESVKLVEYIQAGAAVNLQYQT